jgi:hypothetical protein
MIAGVMRARVTPPTGLVLNGTLRTSFAIVWRNTTCYDHLFLIPALNLR